MVSRDLVIIAHQSGSSRRAQIALWLVVSRCRNHGELWLWTFPWRDHVTPSEAAKIGKVIDAYVRAYQTAELDERVARAVERR